MKGLKISMGIRAATVDRVKEMLEDQFSLELRRQSGIGPEISELTPACIREAAAQGTP